MSVVPAEGRGSFEARIAAFDPSLFPIETSTWPNDRVSLLRVHRLVRKRSAAYRYVEIGAYRGGSLVPHLLDPRCAAVLAIDPRPPIIDDERAHPFVYHGITTAGMLEGLSQHVPTSGMAKLRTIEADVSAIGGGELQGPYDLAFVDGEHTDVAAFSDALGVFPALSPDALIVFHDANLVLDAIRSVQRFLVHLAVPHRLFILPDVVAVIALRGGVSAAEAELGPHALDEEVFARETRRALYEDIAETVRKGWHTKDFGFAPRKPVFLPPPPSLGARLARRLRRLGRRH